jgi:hypothetical protein
MRIDQGHHHDGDAEVSGGEASVELALLKYMIEHNGQHGQELARTAMKVEAAGHPAAAELIRDAVHYIDHANGKLKQAVAAITGEQ